MNDKDKLVSEILADLKNEGASAESTPLYEKIIRVITELKHSPIPPEVTNDLRKRLMRKKQTVSIFKIMTKTAVAAVILLFLFGVAFFNMPESRVNSENVLIASIDKPMFKDLGGVELIAEKHTKIVEKDNQMKLLQGEVLINNYNADKNVIIKLQSMDVNVMPNSIAYFNNGGSYSEVAIFKGDADVQVGAKSQRMNRYNGNQCLYLEEKNFDQPIQGSPEKYASMLNKSLKRANSGAALNSQTWADNNIQKNLVIDRFILDAQKNETFLVKRVNVSSDGNECTVVFNVNDAEKKYEVKKGANIGNWVVKELTENGFTLTDGTNDRNFRYVN